MDKTRISSYFGKVSLPKTLLRFILVFSVMVIFIASVSSVLANDIESSTMIFEGTLTSNGAGYEGTIPMINENAESLGDGIAGFDVYAKNDASATYYGGTQYLSGTVTNNDAYTTAGGWGTWYDPDVADWDNFQLRLVSENWYLEYNPNVGNDDILTGATAAPMSGEIIWNDMYAREENTGTYYDGMGTPKDESYAQTFAGNLGESTSGAWDMDWTWGSEYIPLEFDGFSVNVTSLGGDNYRVTLTPAEKEEQPVVIVESGADFDTIQEAIDEANPGDTINVAAGTYNEDIIIDKSITINGEAMDTVIIDSNGKTGNSFSFGNAGVLITADDVTINDMTITNSDSSDALYGIVLVDTENAKLENVIVKDMGKTGVNVYNTVNTILKTVQVKNNGAAGVFLKSGSVTFDSITTLNNPWGGIGISTDLAEDSTIDVSGIVFTGTNDIDETVDIYLEQGEYGGEITFGFADSEADVIVTEDLSEYVAYGYTQDDATHGETNSYKLFYDSLEDAKNAKTYPEDSYITNLARDEFYVVEGFSIQDAIDAASDGDTIIVMGGTYEESIIVDKQITLIGTNMPIISGNSVDNYIIKITADNVVFDGFAVNGGEAEVTNTQYDYGIWIENTDNVEVKDLSVSNVWKTSSNGIQVDGSTNSNIHDVIISSFHKRGIRYINSNGQFYDSEVIGDNVDVDGTNRVQNLVNLWGGSNVEIYGNTLHNAMTEEGMVPTWDSPAIFISSYGGDGDSQANIHDNEIFDCDTGVVVTSIYANVDNSFAEIYENTFNNMDLVISFEKDTGSADFYDNSMDNFNTAIKYLGSEDLDAEENFWGESNPDFESIISGDVDYDPWYLDSAFTYLSGAACSAGETETQSCGSDVGVCEAGTQTRVCTSEGTWASFGTCDNVGPSIEGPSEDATCSDGIDNDCDGYVDSFDLSDCSETSHEYFAQSELGVSDSENDGASLIGFNSSWSGVDSVRTALLFLKNNIEDLGNAKQDSIVGNESEFDGWDKDASDDVDQTYLEENYMTQDEIGIAYHSKFDLRSSTGADEIGYNNLDNQNISVATALDNLSNELENNFLTEDEILNEFHTKGDLMAVNEFNGASLIGYDSDGVGIITVENALDGIYDELDTVDTVLSEPEVDYYVSNNGFALLTEMNTADTNLQDSITSEATTARANESALSGRIGDIEDDYLIENDIIGFATEVFVLNTNASMKSYVDSSDDSLASEITSEATTARANESALSGRLSSLEADPVTETFVNESDEAIISRVDSIDLGLTSESNLRTSADTVLTNNATAQQTQINTNLVKMSYNDSDVVNTLQSGVTGLQTDVNSLDERAVQNIEGYDIYLAQGWNEFRIPWFVLTGNAYVDELALDGNYSVETVLDGVDFSYLAYYDGSEWQTYIPGNESATTFNDFPTDANQEDFVYHIFVEEGVRLTIYTTGFVR